MIIRVISDRPKSASSFDDHHSDQWLYRPNSESCLDDDHSDQVADGQTAGYHVSSPAGQESQQEDRVGEARKGDRDTPSGD